MARLKEIKTLRSVCLTGSQVTEAGIAELKAALPECEIGGRWYNY